MPVTNSNPPKYAVLCALLLSLVIVLVTNTGARETPVSSSPSAQTPATQPAVNSSRPIRSPTPLPPTTPDPARTTAPTPAGTPIATPGTLPPINTPVATPSGELPLALTLLSPNEGAGVEIGAIRVLGLTRPDAVVEVNQSPVPVAADGTFQQDLLLEEGVNTISATARDPNGNTAVQTVPVLFIPGTSGVPLSVFYPNGLEVQEPQITVLGATRQDAVVGVNGVPVAVNALGIFSATVPLDEGANLVEVVAVDIDGSVNFQTVVVFYLPDSFRESYITGD